MVPPAAQFKIAKRKGKHSTLGRARLGKQQMNPSPAASIRKPEVRTLDPAGVIPEGPPLRPCPIPGPCPVLAGDIRKPLNRLDEKTLTVKEAAYRLGKSADAVYLWLRTGRLRGWQPGGPGCAILVAESSVNAALLFSFEQAGAGRGGAGLRSRGRSPHWLSLRWDCERKIVYPSAFGQG